MIAITYARVCDSCFYLLLYQLPHLGSLRLRFRLSFSYTSRASLVAGRASQLCGILWTTSAVRIHTPSSAQTSGVGCCLQSTFTQNIETSTMFWAQDQIIFDKPHSGSVGTATPAVLAKSLMAAMSLLVLLVVL